MWHKYLVRWEFFTKMCGSVPADPELVKAWIAARGPRVRAPGGKTLDEVTAEVIASLDRGDEFDETECNILTFQRAAAPFRSGTEMLTEGVERVCTVRAATIKAHLKDCARVMSGMLGREKGERAFSTRVVNDLYPDPVRYWIPVLRPDGNPVTKHDGERDKPIHPRPGASALKRFEWIEPGVLEFTLCVLAPRGKARLGLSDLDMLMQYGGTHGYGGERGDGEGKYIATISEHTEG